MVHTVDLEIREQLSDYVAGHTTFHQFQEWFVPIAWEVASTRSIGPTQDLIGEVELRLAEFTSGHWTEAELKEKLAAIPYTATITYPANVPLSRALSASTPVTADPLT